MSKFKLNNHARIVFDLFDSNGLDASWIHKSAWLIERGIKGGLCLCGSAGMGVATNNPYKVPSDLDFVTDDHAKALRFIVDIQHFAAYRSMYMRIMANHNTKFCPDGVSSHYRIESPLWIPVCIFVLKHPVDYFYRGRLRVQNYKQMYRAAEGLTDKDGKPRVPPALHDSNTPDQLMVTTPTNNYKSFLE
jgi:hypothetical protein